CESLKKIDLTVNFVGELTSIECLKNSYNLQELFLTGNPCVNYEGYRQYVIATLPQLMYLDGKQISKSERITAIQQLDTVKPFILQQQKEYAKKRAQEKQEAEAKKEKKKQKTKSQKDKNPGFDGRWYTDINKEDLEKRKDIEKADEENEEDEEAAKKEDDYWDEEIPFTPESRIEMHEQMVEEEKKKEEGKKSGPHVPQREVRLQTDDGTILNVNEAKINFSLSDDEKSNALLLDVECYKHLDTSLLDVDVQPCYVKVVIKGK
ncbi:dynein axonemal assembly factor 11-like, partial [Saccoglossus kowalevskii]|uniref:Protein tilB homolog n=1 Tax=Saccoglossus kowalevskii TaxID=10224 RepID=A0ABM0M310_SACKO